MNPSADPTQHIKVAPRSLTPPGANQDESVSKAPEPVEDIVPAVIVPPVIPDRGFPKEWYEFKRLFNKNAKVPKINKAQAEEIERLAREEAEAEAQAAAEAARIEARERSIQELRDHTDQKPQLTIAFIGVKGAAATTTTMVSCTSTVADITRTLVYAGDFNPASGSAGSRLGKDPSETMSLREFRKMAEDLEKKYDLLLMDMRMRMQQGEDISDLRGKIEQIDNRAEINARLRPTKYGVRVLSADDYILETTEQFGTTTAKMLDILNKNSDYLFVDTANDITTAASRAVLNKADVLVFTANVGIKDSLFMLYTSMEKVRQLGLRDKVANSVVVISNLPEGANLDDYRKYLNRVKPSTDEVIQFIQPADFNGPFMGVPHDPVIARDGQIELEQFADATYQAYLDIDNVIFEQSLKFEELPEYTIPRQAVLRLDSPLAQPHG